MKRKTTFVDRANTNLKVLLIAEEAANEWDEITGKKKRNTNH